MSKTRVETLNGINVGDIIKIKAEHGTFVVKWIETFDSGRQGEFTVIGGATGRNQWRTFREGDVEIAPKKQRQKRRTA